MYIGSSEEKPRFEFLFKTKYVCVPLLIHGPFVLYVCAFKFSIVITLRLTQGMVKDPSVSVNALISPAIVALIKLFRFLNKPRESLQKNGSHSSGGFMGSHPVHAPHSPKFSQFHAVFGKFGKFVCWSALSRMVGTPS